MRRHKITLFYLIFIHIKVLHIMVFVICEIINLKFKELRLPHFLENLPNIRYAVPYMNLSLYNFCFLCTLFFENEIARHGIGTHLHY